MIFIGITGGVGAGKSAILEHIKNNYNSRVMLADNIAHELMMPGTKCYEELRHLFEEMDVYNDEGAFDNIKLAGVLFSDNNRRIKLNSIVHPAVKEYICRQAREERARGFYDILIIEAALLIEEGYGAICDELWYIYTTEDNRRKRLKLNRGYSDEKIDSIFSSQLPESVFRSECCEVIDNNSSPQEAIRKTDELLKKRLQAV